MVQQRHFQQQSISLEESEEEDLLIESSQFPPLRTLEFEMAWLEQVENTNVALNLIPPLDTQEVEVVTIVLEEPSVSLLSDALQEFKFEVATLFRQPDRWVIRRQ